MQQQRVETGIASEHFQHAAGRRVALEHDRDVLFDPGKHAMGSWTRWEKPRGWQKDTIPD